MDLLLRGASLHYEDRHDLQGHAHAWGQLVYAARGAIAVRTAQATWLIPPARAVWLPSNLRHRLHMHGATTLRTLYLAPALAARLPAQACGLDISPLLRELVIHLVQRCPCPDDTASRPFADTLVALLTEARSLPLSLRMPGDRRAVRVAECLRGDPACRVSLSSLAREAGTTLRTLQRLFRQETGLRLGEWRQAARLQHAARLLLEGASVTDAALACGYANPSAFATAFRRQTGMTPLAYRRHYGRSDQ